MKLFSSTINFIRTITSQRSLILSLAKREVHAQYRGSILGLFWTIINLLIMIGVFWFVLSVGFKAKPIGDVPFVVLLTAGLSIWILFSEIVLGSTEIVIQNSQLIKKTLFRPQILPLVKILLILLIHFIFIIILIGLIILEGLPLSWFFFQIACYLFAGSVLALGLALLASALTVFIRDVGKITSVLMKIGFCSTPNILRYCDYGI